MAEELLVDNPVVAPASDPPAAPSGGDGSPPAGLEINYNPMTATRAERVAAIKQMMTGAGTPEQAPDPEPEVAPIVEPVVPIVAPVVPESRANVPDKFLLPTGEVNVEALVKSYLFAEQKISEQGQTSSSELAQLQKTVMDLQTALLTRGPQGSEVPGQPPADPPAASEEEVAAANEAWLDKFYADPKAAMAEMRAEVLKDVQASLEPITKPLAEQTQYNQDVARYTSEVAALAGKYDDVDQYRAAMSDILAKGGEKLMALDNVMEVAYFMAKGQVPAAAPATPAPTPAELLKDATFLAQAAANPDVQKAVLGAFKAQTGAEPKPPVVGAGNRGIPPTMPPTEIRSTKDARAASVEYFKKAFGQTP